MKYHSQLLFTFFWFLLPFSAMAQVSYTTKSFNHDLAPVKVSVSFFNFESFLFPITAGVMVDGNLKDKLFYNVQFRKGLIRNFFEPKDNLLTTQPESKGMVLEAGADLVFADKTKTGKIKVVTNSDFDGYTLEQKYFNATTDLRRTWAFGGGFMEYSRPKYISSDSSAYLIEDKNAKVEVIPGKKIHFNLHTFGFYGGLSKRKTMKAIVSSGTWHYRRYQEKKFYAHVLFGITSEGDFSYNNKTYPVYNTRQVPLGYRIGWKWDNMGAVTGFEFGKRPGTTLKKPAKTDEISRFFSDNPFINYTRLTFHFNLFNNDKNYHMKN